jgi:hypothetical protein
MIVITMLYSKASFLAAFRQAQFIVKDQVCACVPRARARVGRHTPFRWSAFVVKGRAQPCVRARHVACQPVRRAPRRMLHLIGRRRATCATSSSCS